MVAMPAQPADALTVVTAASAASVSPSPIRTVQVVLPSSPPHDPEHLVDGVAWLRNIGIDCWVTESLEPGPLPHLAGHDRHRAETLLDALDRPGIDAVWCGRGGSGALRTLMAADAMALLGGGSHDKTPDVMPHGRSTPVWSGRRWPGRPLIGLSDATALLTWRALRLKCAAIHGPVITQLPKLDSDSAEVVARWLRRPAVLPELRCEMPPRVAGTAEGVLIGGNLTLLAACLGTPEAPVLSGSILLVEEIGEPAYRIDRMFSQLQRAGALRGIVGVACGTFSDCPAPHLVAACLDDWAQRLGVPWAGPFPVGHTGACQPVAIGARYRLDANKGLLQPIGAQHDSERAHASA